MQVMKPFDPADMAYIASRLHRNYVENSDAYQDAEWWEAEDAFMCGVGELAISISQEITALIDFSDNSMIFAYEVLDDLSSEPMLQLIEQVREEGPESVDATKWVESVVAAYPDDLSFNEPQPAPVNVGAALNLCIQAIENLLPGAKHIVADVGLINDALIAGRQAMKELS